MIKRHDKLLINELVLALDDGVKGLLRSGPNFLIFRGKKIVAVMSVALRARYGHAL